MIPCKKKRKNQRRWKKNTKWQEHSCGRDRDETRVLSVIQPLIFRGATTIRIKKKTKGKWQQKQNMRARLKKKWNQEFSIGSPQIYGCTWITLFFFRGMFWNLIWLCAHTEQTRTHTSRFKLNCCLFYFSIRRRKNHCATIFLCSVEINLEQTHWA